VALFLAVKELHCPLGLQIVDQASILGVDKDSAAEIRPLFARIAVAEFIGVERTNHVRFHILFSWTPVPQANVIADLDYLTVPVFH